MANPIFQFNISELSKDTGALKETFEAGNLPAVAAKLQATLHSLEDVRLDIGVTGAIGSGKSTFVNAIRGLGDEDPKSAGTGVVEMTVEPTPYPHPKYFNIIIWDLPGIDTPTFQADEYLQRVLVDRYDFFIIITPDSFTARHAQLARGLLEQGKAFYFVRSKVDVDLAASRSRRPSTFSEQRVLRQIREDCWQRLEAEGLQDPKVFLLSMFELGKYDFGLLEESMVTGVESHKQHALLVALPNLSEAILEKKASSLRQHIWLVATVACGINSSPVPGVQDVACDLYRLIHALEGYYHSFGLDEDSLVKLAAQTGQPLHRLLEVIQGPKTPVTKELVVDMLGQASRDASAFTQELLNVPVLGALATCGISFATVYQMLRLSLDVAVEDAHMLIQTFLNITEHRLSENSNQ
ncbi:Interferon-inducible GTPase 5 [Myotis brandtii]|uniref:Interferon-inducible GTPase 5 n=1 Tax=Myotis brandtii TaxID=109478 RepID=S7NRY4_MYOBR|nr:PREDICTED: interferon-inducible GTPase 5 [Myotis brandtii]EPQ20464.1 Interferon-inducible GTPase 5 [Myotis brandtii]